MFGQMSFNKGPAVPHRYKIHFIKDVWNNIKCREPTEFKLNFEGRRSQDILEMDPNVDLPFPTMRNTFFMAKELF